MAFVLGYVASAVATAIAGYYYYGSKEQTEHKQVYEKVMEELKTSCKDEGHQDLHKKILEEIAKGKKLNHIEMIERPLRSDDIAAFLRDKRINLRKVKEQNITENLMVCEKEKEE